ncbi:alpha/beta fold hydrolase [Pseudomonas sp. RIT411]|jgi:pimeloyl-ACP methyl ester carboxylesterase|uniref:alpha/beta fold hydrolase n=1 Tax=Pseudomonas TaxID=286 RepID=UPI000D34B545|nr:alpha/beta fold hydrolase [Pseudomonas sp. RIT 411]RAU35043.1 alpha/beta fold hydrolase [Pseudomonas sp. RIT 411]
MIRSTDAKTPAGTAYSIAGDGSPLVLIHGVGLSKEMWGGQLAGLAPRYQVIAYDMLGHGASRRPAAEATLDDYAGQLAELLDHLALETAVVVGFSMGGLVARAFALGHPQRLDALVILNSVFNRSVEQRSGVLERTRQAELEGPDANLDSALARWFSREYQGANPAQIQALRQAFANNDPQGYLTTYALFATQDRYGAERLDSIQVPTLVATGELDSGSTPEMARQLAARIPRARTAVLADQRHMMPVESPKLVNALLLDFIDDALGKAPSTSIKGYVA